VTRGSPVMRMAWAVVYAITLVRVLGRLDRIAVIVRANKMLCALLGVAAVSVLWSIDPGVTLHGAVTLVFTTLFAIDMSMHYTITRQIRLVRIALLLVV